MALNKDIYYSLRVAYYSLLNGNIFLNGSALPIYAQGQQVGGNAYVFISSINNRYQSPKTTITSAATIQLSIFVKGDELTGNEHEDIAAQILEIIEPYNGFKVPINGNFYIEKQQVVSDNTMPVFSRDVASIVLERHIQIEHEVAHLQRA